MGAIHEQTTLTLSIVPSDIISWPDVSQQLTFVITLQLLCVDLILSFKVLSNMIGFVETCRICSGLFSGLP